MNKVKVVCNTTPIIGLMSINRLSLLEELFEENIIPEAVERELCANSSKHQQEIEKIKKCIANGKFKVYHVQNEEAVKQLYGRLHYGELEVIISAKECGLSLAIIDERAARKMASSFLVDTIGILGILTLAKQQGLICSVKQDIDILRSNGYRISDALYEQILKRNGEME